MKRFQLQKRHSRRGAITVLSAILAIVFVAMVAFCVDIGYVLSAKEELQRSADSSALAACWEYGQRLSKGSSVPASAGYARATAAQYAALNKVTNHAVSLDANTSNHVDGDVVFGYIADFKDSRSAFRNESRQRI